MKYNTQNKKIASITEKTLIIGIDVGSQTHYARAFDWRNYEYSRKPFAFSNDESGFLASVHQIRQQSMKSMQDLISWQLKNWQYTYPTECQATDFVREYWCQKKGKLQKKEITIPCCNRMESMQKCGICRQRTISRHWLGVEL